MTWYNINGFVRENCDLSVKKETKKKRTKQLKTCLKVIATIRQQKQKKKNKTCNEHDEKVQ